VARSKELWQDPVQQFEFTRSSNDTLVDGAADRKVFVDLSEHERVIADLSKLHQRVLQIGLLSVFPIHSSARYPVCRV
jgi:hypothetical protein